MAEEVVFVSSASESYHIKVGTLLGIELVLAAGGATYWSVG